MNSKVPHYLIMRKVVFLVILLTLAWVPLHANDGVFYAQGNHLVPVQETVVQLQKEVLKLKRDGDWMQVDVDFEFFNPGPAKTVIVGFVTPPAMGDVGEDVTEHPQIREFSAVVNGKDLPFKIAVMEDSGFDFGSDGEVNGQDFIYYFDVHFQEGLNRIRHRYHFRGGSSVEVYYDFPYRLTTGNMWANEEIGDFTLEIDMGDRELFSVPWAFGYNDSPAEWTLTGAGKIGKKADILMESYYRSIYVRDGGIQLKCKHFHPDRDLVINSFVLYNQAYGWGRPDLSEEVSEWLPCGLFAANDSSCLMELNDKQLRILRNFFYARKGLEFQSADLNKYFGQFIWYDPIAGLKADEIKLEEWEHQTIRAVMAEEKRRRK